jgi:CDGSH-type Zn-finger protein
MAQVKITVRPNGPYRVEAPEGSIELVDANGTPYDLTGKPAFSLCRCGGSVNKPFCDGTHSKVGFQAAEAAVRAAGGWSWSLTRFADFDYRRFSHASILIESRPEPA